MTRLLIGLIKVLTLAFLGGGCELDTLRGSGASWLLLLLLARDVIVHYILHDIHCSEVFEGVAICVSCLLLLLLVELLMLVTVEEQGTTPTSGLLIPSLVLVHNLFYRKSELAARSRWRLCLIYYRLIHRGLVRLSARSRALCFHEFNFVLAQHYAAIGSIKNRF